MSMISRTVVLTGVLAGQSVNLRGTYPFVNGELTLTGPEQDVNCEVRNLERNFCAYLKGDPRLESKEQVDGKRDLQQGGNDPAGKDPVHGGTQPDGAGAPAKSAAEGSGPAGPAAGQTGGDADAGNGQPPELKVGADGLPVDPLAGSTPVNEKLKRAVMSLDPSDDSHWTMAGKPVLAAVCKAYGSTGVTRADVEAVAPGYDRSSKSAGS